MCGVCSLVWAVHARSQLKKKFTGGAVADFTSSSSSTSLRLSFSKLYTQCGSGFGSATAS